MNEELIQSLNAYTNALEQKISALEQRVTLLENQLSANSQTDQSVAGVLEQMQQQITQIQATNNAIAEKTEWLRNLSDSMGKAKDEPEVEVELIVGEDENTAEEPMAEEPVAEVTEETKAPEAAVVPEVQEPVAQPKEEVRETVAEPAKEESAPAAEPQEEVKEERPQAVPEVKEDIVQPKAEKPQAATEAQQETKAEVKAAPTQTSLFGAPVKDIRQAISLGDRFLFQRELFAGNGEKMQKALDELNSLDTLDEALEYVREHFDWDKESTAAQLFENVLRRRF